MSMLRRATQSLGFEWIHLVQDRIHERKDIFLPSNTVSDSQKGPYSVEFVQSHTLVEATEVLAVKFSKMTTFIRVSHCTTDGQSVRPS